MGEEAAAAGAVGKLKMVRRFVPSDHECLFTSIAYLTEGSRHNACGQRLRKICADRVAADPDTYCEAVLGMPTVQYVDWIQNPFNWGGENEIGILAAHFDVEIVVVMMEAFLCLPYTLGKSGRIYLLYTGQHYDALVACEHDDAPVESETRKFPVGDTLMDESALDCARMHARIAAEKATRRTVKKLRCTGCSAILDDNDAFQVHCNEVDHDDDFAWMCDEIEVTEEGSDAIPQGRIDLASPDVFTFYNTEDAPLSNLYQAPIEVGGRTYPCVEHYYLACMYSTTPAGDSAAKAACAPQGPAADTLATAPDLATLNILAVELIGQERPDWDNEKVREAVLMTALLAKFTQHEALRTELLGTGGKTIVMVDRDRWLGMSAAGGIPTGKNRMGEALMQVRADLAQA